MCEAKIGSLLPGYNLSNKNFFEMTGAKNFIGNQTLLAEYISSQPQNIFKTHIKQSRVEFNIFRRKNLTKPQIN